MSSTDPGHHVNVTGAPGQPGHTARIHIKKTYAMVSVEYRYLGNDEFSKEASMIVATGAEVIRQARIISGDGYGYVVSITEVGADVEARR